MDASGVARAAAAEPWQVEPAGHRRIAVTLAHAFFDDPVARWACPHDRLRMRVLERFYYVYLGVAERQGWVWARGDGEAAALWLAPGRHDIAARDAARIAASMLHPRLAWRLPMVAAGLHRTEHRHPAAPDHFYLAVLGCHPDSQGRGHGSALLRQTLAICDADGIPAYLESSKQRNLQFYERHGFRVSGQLRLPRGPLVFFMWRDPQ